MYVRTQMLLGETMQNDGSGSRIAYVDAGV